MNGSHQYDDIINLPHHVSTVRAHMSLHDRAAQFLPFAALTGFEDAIQETGRLTQEKLSLSESSMESLNEKLHILLEEMDSHPKIAITYFVSDELKDGGAYNTAEGHVKRIDEYKRTIIMTDGLEIPIEDIMEMDGEIFSGMI